MNFAKLWSKTPILMDFTDNSIESYDALHGNYFNAIWVQDERYSRIAQEAHDMVRGTGSPWVWQIQISILSLAC